MNVEVNGKVMTVEPQMTVAALLTRLGLGQSPCAVEVNRAVVPKRGHADRTLAEGDQVEIVTLVGGG